MMNRIKNKVINIDISSNHYRLERLDDRKYYELWKNSLAIADDYGFYIDFYLYLRDRAESLNLAQIYVTLEKLCGESGKFFDDWKGSFSFPFFLEVSKAGHEFDYLLNIYDHRGSVNFGIRKQLQPHDSYDARVIHQPFPEEFSRQDINEFITYFYGYLQGYFEEIKSSYSQFFFKRIDSNCILFGYKDGNFFEEHYDDHEEYTRSLKLLETFLL
ncbi:hypothetical protein [Aerosakkonema funiforme]|uniref:Uncharacterized protein n=2 Tax=Oscillatoriophycideae TaxID=1301283 RepID=A0A926VH45_9CYAN|nr:hypothetical protein [Aerosakkonema funiforme]MBD2183790.1 hypothetical protein [Aerosakkonema funiforme FACHB-1375]